MSRRALSETFTVPMAIGFALVITGSVLATRPARTGELEATPTAA